ncbi:hypothetical protein [Nocardioides flavescens]|uniref:Uncharacterized protein n=1 Tax=Nocardioides flavescens TaxID=2691959 RepID=A0A6L7F4F1_9ACTN|nr:hypothetical protein [Nocardioides flavescens]MXG92066.1 hypothetical protein [Nocardioides flavescens]
MSYLPNELLSRLVLSRLIAVEFVLDHLVLRFEGDGAKQVTLSCFVFPEIAAFDGSQLRDGDLGYSDRLRSAVGSYVVATQEQMSDGFRIELQNHTIIVRPRQGSLVGPEIALLRGFSDEAWMCWRPGEASFGHLV